MRFPWTRKQILGFVQESKRSPAGPVFLEVCIDVSAVAINEEQLNGDSSFESPKMTPDVREWMNDFERRVHLSQRPLILIGSGITYECFQELTPSLEELKIPVATSWNASDYLDYDSEIYGGRPGAYGMRWSNVLLQQADLVIAVGTRFSFWETGFNWEEFAPTGVIWHFNVDPSEISKPGPKLDFGVLGNVNENFRKIVDVLSNNQKKEWNRWLLFKQRIESELPVNEISNALYEDYCNPFDVIEFLSQHLSREDILIPCSSGGAYTATMQSFKQKKGQLLTNNRGLASMGYGLAGAVGTCFAQPESRVVLVEGEGGFLQNLSELSSAVLHNLNLKVVIFANNGYASIRLSQKANFNGNYVGCDPETGVAIPDLKRLFQAFGLEVFSIDSNEDFADLSRMLSVKGPAISIVRIHPDQPYFPKITSKLEQSGLAKSNALHQMTPELPVDKYESVTTYLSEEKMRKRDV
jgi:acetolactate synthase-1/2/3 large subunit